MTLPKPIALEEAAGRRWPLIVVGAGIAGCLLARQLAHLGVLLVDKTTHPRHKTCGGTLNARALEMLRRFGSLPLLDELGATRTQGVEWLLGSHRYFIDTPTGRAISRRALDEALLQRAVESGVDWLPGTRVLSSSIDGENRALTCQQPDGIRMKLETELVLACDGLHSILGKSAGLVDSQRSSAGSLIGCSIIVPRDIISAPPSARIRMAVGAEGYCGFVAVENDQWDVAAAVRMNGSNKRNPALAAADILTRAGVSHSLYTEGWTLTKPGLGQRPKAVIAERLALVGDAAGYVEPITGEGMAWAMEAAWLAARAFGRGWNHNAAHQYAMEWKQSIGRRRGFVHLAGMLARHPSLARLALTPLAGSSLLQHWVTGRLFAGEVPSP
jgi:flavin-dependent dehydrogenase